MINGRGPAANGQGSATVRRTMKGVLSFIATNRFVPGSGGFPSGSSVTEDHLNAALRAIWQSSSARPDLIVVGGQEKRSINNYILSNRRYSAADERVKELVSTYESDFGVCRIVLCRWVPTGTVIVLDSSRVSVVPLAGRSFHYKPLASTGDRENGQVIGEYTVELRNENAHAVISGFTA